MNWKLKDLRWPQAAVFAVLFLGACTKVGPDFEPLAAATPDDWNARELSIIQTDEDTVDWWENFNDSILNELVETARA